MSSDGAAKEQLRHLPAKKQRHIEAIVAMIRDAVEVEMIILFGSHARGDFVSDLKTGYFSDYDILVIVEDAAIIDNHSLWSRLESKFRSMTRPVSVGLIVHDIADVNHQLEQGWFFFSDVKKDGIVLYDSGRHKLAEAKPRSANQRRVYARECFSKYFDKANWFLAGALWYMENDRNNEAAFLSHQATETYYKCALLVITAYRPQSHNIEALGEQCVNLDPRFRALFPLNNADGKRRFKLLKAAYISARYSLSYKISREDLEALTRNIVTLRERTEEVCEQRITAMRSQSDNGEHDEQLKHLPAQKQRHLEAIVAMIRDALEVELIILFGSHARGDFVSDRKIGYFSDYDILVIVEDEATVENHSLWLSLEDRCENVTQPVLVGLLVHDIADVNAQIEQGLYFVSEIKREGITLYDSGRYQLAEAQAKTALQRQIYTQECFAQYRMNAMSIFTHAITAMHNDQNSIAAFCLHQTTETLYKYAILVITAEQPKTHDIEALEKRCIALDPSFRDIFPLDDPDSKRRFELLTDAYVSPRYSPSYRISRDDLEELARSISRLRRCTEDVCAKWLDALCAETGSELE